MPKPKLIKSASVLLVKDVVETAEYYRDKLGFKAINIVGDPPVFCISSRDGFEIMFGKADPEKIVPNWKIREETWNVYFWVDDVKALYEEYKKSGAKIDYELYLTPYNNMEFGISDNNGYSIGFGQHWEENL